MELSIDQTLQQGVAAHKEGKLQEAEKLYRAILSAQPNHPDANHNLGVLAVAVGKAPEGLPLFKLALEVNPKQEQFWLSYIDALVKVGHLDTARQVLQQGKDAGLKGDKFDALEAQLVNTVSVPLSPGESIPSKEQIDGLVALYSRGNLEEALVQGTALAARFPNDFTIPNILGAVYAGMGRHEDAVIHYNKVIELKPAFAEVYSNLGASLNKLDRNEEAVKAFNKAIELKPDFHEAYNNLGNALNALDRYEEAITSFNTAIKLKLDFVEANYNLGLALHALGRYEESVESYHKAIELKPNHIKAYNNLGTTLIELGKSQAAVTSFNKAIKLKPDYAQAYSNLGNALSHLGRHEEAIANFDKAIELKPDSPEAYSNLGKTFRELENLDKAEIGYKNAISLNPEFEEGYDILGVIKQKKEEFDSAEKYYRRYKTINPNNIGKTLSMGSILYSQGNFERALKFFDIYNNKEARASALITLYAMGRIDDIFKRIEDQVNFDGENIRVAAIAAFIEEREKRNTAYNFCNNPLNFIKVSNISSHREDMETFVMELINELSNIKTSWNAKTVRNGYQAKENVFKNPQKNMRALRSIIIEELGVYHSEFQNESCSFIQNWPVTKKISGWHVIYKQQGHQVAHIHPNGWLSGVIYLKTVPLLEKDEGAIKFSLNGPAYYHREASEFIYPPKVGDMVFFPSSLHHSTIPFSTDADRICISFDLWPETLNKL